MAAGKGMEMRVGKHVVSFDFDKKCACGKGILPFYDDCVRCNINGQKRPVIMETVDAEPAE